MSTRTLTYGQAVQLAEQLLIAMGTPPDSAAVVAYSLADSNLCGHDSHGLIRLPWYAGFVSDGRADPRALPHVVSRRGATAVVNGRGCWGQLAGKLAVEVVAPLAQQFGIAAVTIRHANHVGRLGEYSERLIAAGLVSLMWCNADPAVAAYGGRGRLLGTNPFAAGIPTGTDEPSIVVDFATAAVAEGKLRIERLEGRSIPPGLVQDADGLDSTDPSAFYNGGALLPFGQHKGAGLAVLIEMLGGALSGNHIGVLPEYRWGNGTVLIAIDPSAFGSSAAFSSEVSRASHIFRESTPTPQNDHVLLPGDVELATRARRSAEGIPISDEAWNQLTSLGEQLGVTVS